MDKEFVFVDISESEAEHWLLDRKSKNIKFTQTTVKLL